ncbi:hypothetical protein PV328_001895 [Microctonus aethiopoides]|nr:hypothetical protein PV328_001895 [Microctonus aethiopoides]
MSESTRAAIYSENINKPDSSCSVYDWYYNQTFYVDKTLLIKELFAIHHALITAPSRFGKSLNMDMVRRFFEIEVDEDGKQIDHDVEEDELVLKEVQSQSKNFKLFHGKKISSDKEFMFKHFGSYPTIYVDFTRVNGSNFEQILDGLRLVIHRAFRKHAYLKKSDLWNREEFNKNTFMKYFDTDQYESLSLAQIKCGLVFLSEVLHAYYGKKVFVFIDEFDIPVNSMVYEDDMDPEDRKETLKVLREIIGDLLKGSEKTVERSLSNACQQLGGILSGSANNTVAPYYI